MAACLAKDVVNVMSSAPRAQKKDVTTFALQAKMNALIIKEIKHVTIGA
jgi:hypothetical protein